MRISRLRANSVADALPVVFCRCRNPVTVIATANLVGGLKLAKRILHRCKLGFGGNSGVESCRKTDDEAAIGAVHREHLFPGSLAAADSERDNTDQAAATHLMPTVLTNLQMLGFPQVIARGAQLAAALFATAVVWKAWRRLPHSLAGASRYSAN